MELDIVELLFAAEEKLGVHIHDADASNLSTPRMIADYVYSRVRNTEDRSCTSQIGFYRRATKNVYPNSHFHAILALANHFSLASCSLDIRVPITSDSFSVKFRRII